MSNQAVADQVAIQEYVRLFRQYLPEASEEWLTSRAEAAWRFVRDYSQQLHVSEDAATLVAQLDQLHQRMQ